MTGEKGYSRALVDSAGALAGAVAGSGAATAGVCAACAPSVRSASSSSSISPSSRSSSSEAGAVLGGSSVLASVRLLCTVAGAAPSMGSGGVVA